MVDHDACELSGELLSTCDESALWWQAYCAAIRARRLPQCLEVAGAAITAETIADAAVDAYEARWGLS